MTSLGEIASRDPEASFILNQYLLSVLKSNTPAQEYYWMFSTIVPLNSNRVTVALYLVCAYYYDLKQLNVLGL